MERKFQFSRSTTRTFLQVCSLVRVVAKLLLRGVAATAPKVLLASAALLVLPHKHTIPPRFYFTLISFSLVVFSNPPLFLLLYKHRRPPNLRFSISSISHLFRDHKLSYYTGMSSRSRAGKVNAKGRRSCLILPTNNVSLSSCLEAAKFVQQQVVQQENDVITTSGREDCQENRRR